MAEKRGARHFWQRKSSRGPGSGTRAGPKTADAGMPARGTSAVCGNFETAAGAAYYKVKEGKVFMTLLKRFAVTAVAGMVAGAMLCTSAAAVAVTPAKDTKYELAAGKITLTINKDELPIKPGNEYVLLVARGEVSDNNVTIDASTLTYIDQAEATAGGSLSFTVYPKSAQKNDIILLGGEFDGVPGPLIIGYINVTGELVSIPSISVADKVDKNGTVNKANDIGLKVMSADNTVLAEFQADEAGSVSFTIPEGQTTVTLQLTRPGYLTLTIENYSATDNIDDKIELFKTCAGDVNSDGAINGVDILSMFADFGATSDFKNECADVNRDGAVNGNDLLVLCGNFGKRDMKLSAK